MRAIIAILTASVILLGCETNSSVTTGSQNALIHGYQDPATVINQVMNGMFQKMGWTHATKGDVAAH